MGPARWLAVVALASALAITSGCSSLSPDGAPPESSVLPGLVQIERQDGGGATTIVAYMTYDADPRHQWWLSTEPLPIGPDLATKVVMRYISDVSLTPEQLCSTYRPMLFGAINPPKLYDVWLTSNDMPCGGW